MMMRDAGTAHQFTNEPHAPQHIPDDEHDTDDTAKLLHRRSPAFICRSIQQRFRQPVVSSSRRRLSHPEQSGLAMLVRATTVPLTKIAKGRPTCACVAFAIFSAPCGVNEIATLNAAPPAGTTRALRTSSFDDSRLLKVNVPVGVGHWRFDQRGCRLFLSKPSL